MIIDFLLPVIMAFQVASGPSVHSHPCPIYSITRFIGQSGSTKGNVSYHDEKYKIVIARGILIDLTPVFNTTLIILPLPVPTDTITYHYYKSLYLLSGTLERLPTTQSRLFPARVDGFSYTCFISLFLVDLCASQGRNPLKEKKLRGEKLDTTCLTR